MKKHLPLLILAFVVVFVISGFIAFTSANRQQPPITARDGKVSPTQSIDNKKALNQSIQSSSEKKVTTASIKKTDVPGVNPKAGEIIVYGEVKAVDVEKRVLTIDQQMDDNSVKISPNIPVSKDAVVRSKQGAVSLAQIKPGDSVGIIVTRDGQGRAVLVNY